MANSFNKMFSELIGKMDEKVLQAKINTAIDMLQKGNTEELAKKINKMDKEELIGKIDEFDKTKLKDLPFDVNDLRKKIKKEDLQKLSALLGDNGDEIVSKLNKILE